MAEYIDKNQLIQRIKQEPTDGMFTEEILTAIDEIETADVAEVRHGKWIGQRGKNRKYDDFNCSVCGYHSNTSNRDRLGYYCENCGAKMDLGDDEE